MNHPWDEQHPMSDINVTPFVDVLLVLLIIFMVTAPILYHAVEVDLPRDSYSDEAPTLDQPLRILIHASGEAYFKDQSLGLTTDASFEKQLQQKLLPWKEQHSGDLVADIEADQKTPYRALIPVITRLKEQGIGMNLVIQPEAAASN